MSELSKYRQAEMLAGIFYTNLQNPLEKEHMFVYNTYNKYYIWKIFSGGMSDDFCESSTK